MLLEGGVECGGAGKAAPQVTAGVTSAVRWWSTSMVRGLEIQICLKQIRDH